MPPKKTVPPSGKKPSRPKGGKGKGKSRGASGPSRDAPRAPSKKTISSRGKADSSLRRQSEPHKAKVSRREKGPSRSHQPKRNASREAKISKHDLELARLLRERREAIDSDVKPRKGERRSAFLKRRSAAKSKTPRSSPPSKSFKNNRAYRQHRGYYYKGSDGKWRTPDGRVARGQKRIAVRGEPLYDLPKARRFNAQRRAKLTREDAYITLLSHGARLSRSQFDRIVGKARDRDTISDKIRKANEEGRFRSKPSRAEARREIRERFREAGEEQGTSSRDATISIEIGAEQREIAREGSGFVDDEGRHYTREELEDIWGSEFFGFDDDGFFEDFDLDGGDTP